MQAGRHRKASSGANTARPTPRSGTTHAIHMLQRMFAGDFGRNSYDI
jgi:hypothetical protein